MRKTHSIKNKQFDDDDDDGNQNQVLEYLKVKLFIG